ncbi:MAG: sensor histidine kinase [Verrucomicrobiota bacterium]
MLTFHDWDLSFLQDATGGIFIRNRNPSLRPGTEVEVEGFSARGRTLPMVTGFGGGTPAPQAQVRALGPGQWPQPIHVIPALLDQEVYGAQWVSVSGKVTGVSNIRDGIMLDLISDGLPVQAGIPNWPQNWVSPGYLRNLTITARGVVSRRTERLDGSSKAAKTVLCVPSIQMVEVAPEGVDALFQRPRIAYADLFSFSTWEKPAVKIYGQVLFARPGLGFFLFMENKVSVWVQTSAPGKLVSGNFVEAVGRFESWDGRALITDANFRVEKSGGLPPRQKLTAVEIRTNSISNHGIGSILDGWLVEQLHGVAEDSLVMEDGGVVFLARLLHAGTNQLPALERGMRLRLGGVLQTKRMPLPENLPAPFVFQLWLTSPADVEIIQRPSWWTVPRVFGLCVVILVLGLAAVGWAALLRRQVARQSAVIGHQMERDAVTQERARIARELHDSLGQELVGIALQLDSASRRFSDSPPQAELALNTARKMVRHSQAETKRSVADLRAGELDSTDFPTALEEILQPMVERAASTRLDLKVQGTPLRLEGVAEHHLLRMGQEAVANALQHALAEIIEVLVAYREREVVLEVRDNGRGFDANEALAIASGHFGLLGLRERANKLRGKLRIESSPGSGTTISVTVPINGQPTK